MTTHEILKAARKRIEKPENWTQHFFAKDKDKNLVGTTDPRAVCWCSAGAINASHPDIGCRDRAIDELANYMDGDVVGFNDDHDHATVLSAFDSAIAATAPRPA